MGKSKTEQIFRDREFSSMYETEADQRDNREPAVILWYILLKIRHFYNWESTRMKSLAVILLLFSSGDALQCYKGACFPGISPCSDEMSLQETTCPQGFMCMKMTGLVNSQEMKTFDCIQPNANAQQLGIEDGGCADPKEFMEDLGVGSMGAAFLGQMSDMEMCLCDTPLCNTASKKAFATFLGFLLFFLLNFVI